MKNLDNFGEKLDHPEEYCYTKKSIVYHYEIFTKGRKNRAMKEYVKPVVLKNEDVAEGVYMASGDLACDSKYMNGVWQPQNTSDWGDVPRGYKEQFGCLGCPANTGTACGLQTHYPESGPAVSYDTDNGNRKPSWEAKGYGPDEIVNDWVM